MCLAREESLPKDVSHAHRKAEWRASFAWCSSPELVWNEVLHATQVFAVGPSRLVCSRKLEDRADSRIRGFSVGVFLGRVVVSNVGRAWVDNQSKCMEGCLNSDVKAGKAWRRAYGYPGGTLQNESSRGRFHMVKMTKYAKPADVHTVYLPGTRRGWKSGNVRHGLIRGTTSRPMAGFSTSWLLPRGSDGYVEFRTERNRKLVSSALSPKQAGQL